VELKPSYKLSAPAESFRPTLMGRNYAVACGHYLAAMAAARVLDAGGNAVDAGVTAAMCLAVLQPDIVSFAGVAPTLVYSAADRKVTSLAGLGWWPAATDIERLRAEGGDSIPEGLLRTVMPAAPATHIEALRRFGTISFAEAARPAAELASRGFGMYAKLATSIAADAASYARWPSSAAVFLPGGNPPKAGELFRQEDLARTIAGMIDASERASGGREARLAAAHDYLYRGPVARAIHEYHAAHRGFVTADDLAAFEVPVEQPLSVRYGDYEVFANQPWCQGVTLLQALATLRGMGLGRREHNSSAYLHLVIEAFDLAFADREAYLGDPKFVRVPVEGMLSEEYAAFQRARIDERRAFGEMPRPGRPRGSEGLSLAHFDGVRRARAEMAAAPDTIYCAVIDRQGNVYSATLSDNTHDTPVIPGTGLAVSSRGSQSRLDPRHPSVVGPGRRPRLTPAPALVTRGGEPFMALGTPGGDVQMQAMLQTFANVVEFGMPLQRAIESPRAWSVNFPNSFAPHDYLPGGLCVEGGIDEAVIGELAALGHDVQRWARFPAAGGGVCAVMRDPATGLVHAGADPRRECYALAW
jgi:gamma-glutamyltranspeptidase/glutathione hydrolase